MQNEIATPSDDSQYPSKTVQERFWKRVHKTEGCRLWIGGKTSEAYGLYGGGRYRIRLAHRLSWIIHRGAIPDGLCILHHCDTPLCVNPEHLFCGTRLDNNQDRHSKGRTKPPTFFWRKVTDEKIRIIKSLHEEGQPQSEIARLLSVHQSTISKVINKKYDYCR